MPDVAPSNPQNEVHESRPHNRSRLPLSYRFYDTHRFGEVHPFFVAETVPSDSFHLRPVQEIQSYTLRAPLMDEISVRQFLGFVPMEAILPLNWDKFYTNPVQGEDVSDLVGPCVPNFWNIAAQFHQNSSASMQSLISNSSITAPWLLTALFRWLVFNEYLFSNGSLLTSLGIHGNARFRCVNSSRNSQYSWDYFFDNAVQSLASNVASFVYNRTGKRTLYVNCQIDQSTSVSPDDRTNYAVSLRTFLSIFRDDPSGSIDQVVFEDQSTLASLKTALSANGSYFDSNNTVQILLGDGETPTDRNGLQPLNLSRIWAYQLICAEYFTNDHVDYIFDSNLFRQYIWQLYLGSVSSGIVTTFSVNGFTYQYDSLSGYVFSTVFSALSSYWSTASALYASNSAVINRMALISAALAFRPSLRFKDYFTGSRTQPLAIDTSGETGVSVNSNQQISVIDVTRGIQRQRFLNAANLSGRRVKEYVKQMFGVDQKQDYHHAIWLAEKGSPVYGDQTQNTGSEQYSRSSSVTSTFRNVANNNLFDVDFDREGVFIAVNYYDAPRSYSKTTERQAFIKSRYDMFNTYMQFVGDQPIFSAEIGGPYPTIDQASGIWSYTGRDMQWKQRYNQASGGFIEALPGWTFLADKVGRTAIVNLDPDYIRSVPSELDVFYLRLTGFSLGTYFHFIVKTQNQCEADRPMAYSPTIL